MVIQFKSSPMTVSTEYDFLSRKLSHIAAAERAVLDFPDYRSYPMIT